MNKSRHRNGLYHNSKTVLGLLAISILAYCLYLPGLAGGFLHDDFVNIVQNSNLHVDSLDSTSLQQVFIDIRSGTPGFFSRPVSQLSFMINYVLAGLDPYWFKVVNVLVHLLTGILVYFTVLLLCRALSLYRPEVSPSAGDTQGQLIAVLTSAFWLLHPLQVSTVLYVVQRMAQLSTLFTMGAFCLYLVIRIRQFTCPERSNVVLLLVALLLVWPLAIFSKENAVILPLLCLGVEATIFRFSRLSSELKLLHGLLIIALLLSCAYLLVKPDFILSTYTTRDFNLPQRLMTESRILWDYVGRLLVPSIGAMGFYNDDIPLSLNLMAPLSTLISLTAWLVVIFAAISLRRIAPVFSFAVMWFLTGHLIESSVFGLELSYEHRNYLPSIGILFALVYAGVRLACERERLRKILIMSCCTVLILFSAMTALRNGQWSSNADLVLTEVQNHPRSYRANSELVRLLIASGKYDDAAEAIKQAENSERASADIYFARLSLEHILRGGVSEAFYAEILERFSHMLAHVSIVNKLEAYISDSARYQWESPEVLIRMTHALLVNPHLSGAKSQGSLHLVLTKLYSDTGDMAKLEQHIKQAYSLFPENISISKVYINVLIAIGEKQKARLVVEQRLGSAMTEWERGEFMKLRDAL